MVYSFPNTKEYFVLKYDPNAIVEINKVFLKLYWATTA